MQSPPANEKNLLTIASTGNAEAFDQLVEPHRKPLMVHCYRLSGSLDDAEDIVQETFFRAWNKLESFSGQGSFRNWLYVIATRHWIDEVRKRKKQVLLPLNGQPADPNSPPRPPGTDASWLDPLPESWLAHAHSSAESSYVRRETISIAFMVALQKLNARQRVVLILRSVYNWSARDVAEILDLTVPAVNNLLYRARQNLSATPYEEMPAPQPNLDRFVKAWEGGDVQTLVALLHEKATFAMPPMNVWYAGAPAIEIALQNFVFTPGINRKLLPTSANGLPAFAMYQGSGEPYQASGLLLLIYGRSEEKIMELISFLSPRLVVQFGLPQTLLP